MSQQKIRNANIVDATIDEAKLDASVNASLDLADTALQPSKLVIDGSGNPAIVPEIYSVANPTGEAGLLKIFSRTKAGRSLFSIVGSSGLDYALQPHSGMNNIRIVKGTFGIAAPSTTFMPVTPIVSGTATSASYANTNLWTRTSRTTAVSVATAGSLTGWRTTNSGSAQHYIRGGREAWFVIIRFAIVATVSDRQIFAGLTTLGTTYVTGDPSATVNIIALGMDSADTNLQIMHNDASGTATKIDLGTDFPAPTANTDFYELRLYQAASTNTVGYYVENLSNGNKADGTLTTDLPATDTALAVQCSVSNGATASAVTFGLNSIYVETDY